MGTEQGNNVTLLLYYRRRLYFVYPSWKITAISLILFLFLSLMWTTFFEIFIGFITVLLLFYVLFFLAARFVGFELPNQGSILHPLHWKVKSQPLELPGRALIVFLYY